MITEATWVIESHNHTTDNDRRETEEGIMPCLQHTCLCGTRLISYVPKSVLARPIALFTSQDLERLDTEEDAEAEIALGKRSMTRAMRFVDGRTGEPGCPACDLPIRYSSYEGLLLSREMKALTCGHLFWWACLRLAREMAWEPAGVVASDGACDDDYLNGLAQTVRADDARGIADGLERALDSIPESECQGAPRGIDVQTLDPRQALSGRFRPDVEDLIAWLRKGSFVLLPDVAAVSMYSADQAPHLIREMGWPDDDLLPKADG